MAQQVSETPGKLLGEGRTAEIYAWGAGQALKLYRAGWPASWVEHEAQVSSALAEFERELIRERTRAGLQAARARGRHGGRPRLLAGTKKLAMVQAMYDDKSTTIEDICQTLHISRATLYRYLKANRSAAEITFQEESD